MAREINKGITNLRNQGSRIVTGGGDEAPRVSLMHAAGVLPQPADKNKKIITVINSVTNHIPGHAHLEEIGQRVVAVLKDMGYTVWYANVGGCICDGVAMGHFGMKYSLASRELIADQVETILGAHPCDGWIGIANCDKIVPGMLMAMVRVNIPAVYLSGGPMLAGEGNTDLISVFEGLGKLNKKEISSAAVDELAFRACPTCGSCAGMFTANSMNCLSEVSGLALPGNGTITAMVKKGSGYEINPERLSLAQTAAKTAAKAVEENIRPLDFFTSASIDNAFRLDVAMGGSTNTVLHTLAIANEAGIDYDLQQITAIAADTPNICKVAPSRQEIHVENLHAVGGINAILKELAANNKIDTASKTVTGKTIGEIISGAPAPDGDIVRSCSAPFSSSGGLAVMYGNLAPGGAVLKTAGVEESMRTFSGPAVCFDSQDEVLAGLRSGKVKDGDVVV
ncbi:MAG TPA: dihydroxy-acid dehydratase, partial [Spirochaetota bacterium]|nr:dihydroxy-acid dehydratase [Spirochaetota bacterium]